MNGRIFDNDTGEQVNAAPRAGAQSSHLGDLPPIPNWLNWGLVVLFGYHLIRGLFRDE